MRRLATLTMALTCIMVALPLLHSTRADEATWRGEYFNNMNLQGDPVMVRQDAEIDFDWGLGSPNPAVFSDGFSVRWTRRMGFTSGYYWIIPYTDDGVQVFLDGKLVIDEWFDRQGQPAPFLQYISSGEHIIMMYYYERYGGAKAKLEIYQGQAPPVAPPPAPTSGEGTVDFWYEVNGVRVDRNKEDYPKVHPGTPYEVCWRTDNIKTVKFDNEGVPGNQCRSLSSYVPKTHKLDVFHQNNYREIRYIEVIIE